MLNRDITKCDAVQEKYKAIKDELEFTLNCGDDISMQDIDIEDVTRRLCMAGVIDFCIDEDGLIYKFIVSTVLEHKFSQYYNSTMTLDEFAKELTAIAFEVSNA